MAKKRVRPDESIDAAIRRVMTALLDAALDDLTVTDGTDHDRDAAVHDARKKLKQARAIVRLVREPIGDRAYHHANRTLRDAGRLLSDVRDAVAMVETVDAIGHRTRGDVPAALVALRADLREHAGAVSLAAIEHRDVDERAAVAVREVRGAVPDWRLDADGTELIRAGLTRTHSRAGRGLAEAYRDPTTEAFHDWRKRAKYLRYQCRFLRVLGPELHRTEQQADRLGDLLGDDHDLAVLRDLVVARLDERGPASGLRSVLDLIDSQRVELQVAARTLGTRLDDRALL